MNFKGYDESDNRNSIGNGSKPPTNLTLLRQPSIYSLTFEEFQSTIGGLGKDFGSMNMDELLKNIWTAEETQSLAVSSSANGGQGGKNNTIINNDYYYNNPNGNLQRQGSLTLPRTLSQKTVDEVWRDLMKDNGGANSTKDNSGGVVPSASALPQRQQTLGEMTLEEFLVRAGVVREDNNVPLQVGRPHGNQWFNGENTGLMLGFQQANGNLGNTNTMVNSHNPVPKQPSTLSLQVNTANPTQHQQPPLFPKPPNVAFAAAAAVGPMHLLNNSQLDGRGGMIGVQGGGLTVVESPTSQISSPPEVVTRSKGDASLHSPVSYVINRPRKSNPLEKVVERRQRRMIKNRESAARSRARKLAYTIELEAEVTKLKELNQELKRKQAKFVEMQNNNQALVTLKGAWGGKRQCLRRTLTGPW